jgi:hypothetical protein
VRQLSALAGPGPGPGPGLELERDSHEPRISWRSDHPTEGHPEQNMAKPVVRGRQRQVVLDARPLSVLDLERALDGGDWLHGKDARVPAGPFAPGP